MVAELKRPRRSVSRVSRVRNRLPNRTGSILPDYAPTPLLPPLTSPQAERATHDAVEGSACATAVHASQHAPAQVGITFIHVRLAHFYAQATERQHPEGVGKPLIIGGQADQIGRVLDVSQSAYAAGIRPGMPLRTAARNCTGGIFVEPDWDTYTLALAQVRELYHHYCTRVYLTSRGTAWLDSRGSRYRSAFQLAERLRRELKQLGFFASVGAASTPLCAERASAAAVWTGGLRVVMPGQEEAFLSPYALSALPKVSPKLIHALRAHGIHTIGHLLRLEPRLVGLQFGEEGRLLRQVISGPSVSGYALDPAPTGASQRWRFPRDLPGDTSFVAVAKLAELLSLQLQASNTPGRLLLLRLHSGQGERLAQAAFPVPIMEQDAIERAARGLFRSLHHPGMTYKGAALRMVLLGTDDTPTENTAITASVLALEQAGGNHEVQEMGESTGRGLQRSSLHVVG